MAACLATSVACLFGNLLIMASGKLEGYVVPRNQPIPLHCRTREEYNTFLDRAHVHALDMLDDIRSETEASPEKWEELYPLLVKVCHLAVQLGVYSATGRSMHNLTWAQCKRELNEQE
jgi:hypothetical protein